jgi:glycosyltransferase involved in cell wall biosynthesis
MQALRPVKQTGRADNALSLDWTPSGAVGHAQRKLRVAMLGLRGIPANYGGVERAVEELGARLAMAGHDVTVFCMKARYGARPATHRGVRLRYLAGLEGKHLEMLSHAALGSIVAGLGRFDIIHFHASGPSLFAWLPRLVGKPVVCTLHGQDWRAPKWGRFARAALTAGEWAACHLPTRTIAVSESQRRYLREFYAIDPDYVPNGVDQATPVPLAAEGERFGLAPQEYLISVGRLTPGKNIHQLIEAFRGVRTAKKLVIVGGDANAGEYAKSLKSLAAGDGRVIFTGLLPGRSVSELLSNAYLFAFPTAHEGMPVALLEALAHGVPVIVSDIPPNLEVIANGTAACGLSFQTGSVVRLAERLQHALDNPAELAPLRTEGPLLVEKRYNWASVTELTLRLYREAAGWPAVAPSSSGAMAT